MERNIVDGGVREGRAESAHFPGMIGLSFTLLLAVFAVCLVLKWLVFGFP